jgi:short-subunit dehydrogenase
MAEGLALVTGASTGIGLELARCAARDGHPLLIAANEPEIERAAEELRGEGVAVEAAQIDLSTDEGVLALWARVGAREVDVVAANAGIGYGHRFVEQDWEQVRETIGLNALGTARLLHLALPRMIARGRGRILVTGSVAGYMPGAFMATYNATKAFLDSLSYALREEIRDLGGDVTITCLMPGATETPFFDRGGMRETVMGESPKRGPEFVAQTGWEAMKAGQAGITPGLLNKLMATFAGAIPDAVLARMHRVMLETPDEGPDEAKAAPGARPG